MLYKWRIVIFAEHFHSNSIKDRTIVIVSMHLQNVRCVLSYHANCVFCTAFSRRTENRKLGFIMRLVTSTICTLPDIWTPLLLSFMVCVLAQRVDALSQCGCSIHMFMSSQVRYTTLDSRWPTPQRFALMLSFCWHTQYFQIRCTYSYRAFIAVYSIDSCTHLGGDCYLLRTECAAVCSDSRSSCTHSNTE